MSDTLYDKGKRFTRLNSAGTTVIRTSPTLLLRIMVNNFSTGGVVNVYDGVTTAAGQRIAAISANAAGQQGTYFYNVALSGGLTVDITNSPDVTIVYQ